MRVLIVVDMQNDFIDGALGTSEAVAIVPNVVKKIEEYKNNGDKVIFTQDTHSTNYLNTMEGKHLPIPHCIQDTHGWHINEKVEEAGGEDTLHILKPSFGYPTWFLAITNLVQSPDDTIELCGLCTDICVVSNALIIKALFPETEIYVDSSCCAGVTPESHEAALTTMKMCQINVL